MMPMQPTSPLLENFADFRTGPQKKIAIYCPVGSESELPGFFSHVKSLGIDSAADFVFILRGGLKLPSMPLPAFCASEKHPLGTSGCFFAGQSLAYQLGYETMVAADLDAFLDSRETFDSLLSIAQKGACAVPLSKPPGGEGSRGYFVINQWGACPRSAIDAAGFVSPYNYRGGEDYEYALRLRKAGLLRVFTEGFSIHPREGSSIYHKSQQPKKYYPYVCGLMRAFLLSSSYDFSGLPKYFLWHAYYSFFADAMQDLQLHAAAREAGSFSAAFKFEDAPCIFSLEKNAGGSSFFSGFPPALFTPFSLASLLAAKGFSHHGERITLKASRLSLAFRIASALLLAPYRFLQSLGRAWAFLQLKKSVPFPPKPSNLQSVQQAYLGMVR